MQQTGRLFQETEEAVRHQRNTADTILDKAGQQLKTSEEKLARWKRHFEHTLNVQRQVAADLTELEDNAGSDTPGVTRKEVESVVVE